MPLYEYKCQSCGEVFERIEKFSAAPLESHDGCGGKVERLISTSAFQFKGSGFYATDYARTGTRKKNGRGGDDSKRDESKPKETGGDSAKPAETKPTPAPAAKQD